MEERLRLDRISADELRVIHKESMEENAAAMGAISEKLRIADADNARAEFARRQVDALHQEELEQHRGDMQTLGRKYQAEQKKNVHEAKASEAELNLANDQLKKKMSQMTTEKAKLQRTLEDRARELNEMRDKHEMQMAWSAKLQAEFSRRTMEYEANIQGHTEMAKKSVALVQEYEEKIANSAVESESLLKLTEEHNQAIEKDRINYEGKLKEYSDKNLQLQRDLDSLRKGRVLAQIQEATVEPVSMASCLTL
ncbi:hypothetical protein B0H17DRAFT_1051044 [Mycena rosella]|uniref:Uncharacterized protein n=1 Tax=Mycena rosella TaxID=1033263 RepID=A0AAD7DUF3_MYCRO|nr:hypothetical protein B0H17DRAFT_1051044 [Mycena rosella]